MLIAMLSLSYFTLLSYSSRFSEMAFVFFMDSFEFFTTFAIRNRYWRKEFSIIWWSLDQPPISTNFLWTEFVNSFNWELKFSPENLALSPNSAKKIKFISSSIFLNLKFGFYFLSNFSYEISFSIKMVLESSSRRFDSLSNGTKTGLSFYTIF